jgi:CheY-like chemotaxis protein
MNGDMKVDSEIGKGSTFTITFPIVDETIAIEDKVKEVEIEEKAKIASAEPTVLIVEDNQDNSYFVEVILNKLGIKYYSVPSAGEAFDYLKQYKIDLILMDISLISGMNGEEAFKVIRQNKNYENIPIIAMTAHAMLGDRDHFVDVGFDDYISKPFTVDQLTELIFKFLRKGLEQQT